MQNPNQRDFRVGKAIKKKGDKLYVKWKGYDASFISWIDKKRHIINEWIFAEVKCLRGTVKVDLDLSNYLTKANFKNAVGVDTSDFAKKTNLAHLKSDVDKKKCNLSNLESKVDKSDVDKLVLVLLI